MSYRMTNGSKAAHAEIHRVCGVPGSGVLSHILAVAPKHAIINLERLFDRLPAIGSIARRQHAGPEFSPTANERRWGLADL